MNEDPPKLESRSLKKEPTLNLHTLSKERLLKMRNEIDGILNLSLENIGMEEELAIQLMQAKALYQTADENVPANQKAQVLNTISSIIASISKTAVEVYSVARLKKIEAAVLAAVTPLDSEAKARFFDLYKEYLEKGST